MTDKLNITIEKIASLCRQNPEFDSELRRRLGINKSGLAALDDNRLSDIYEYCIEKIIRKQAEEFYADFPLKLEVPYLVDDYCRMESFRRKDNFWDFCLALYQQIERITNKLCDSQDLNDIAAGMWHLPAYVVTGNGISPSIDIRNDSKYTISSLVLTKTKDPQEDKTAKELRLQAAVDKMRAVVYFVGYKACMRSSDYYAYHEITSLLYNIYQCRNMNHRGGVLSPPQQSTINRISVSQSLYCFKFIGVLAQYVEYTRDGITHIPEILAYVKSLNNNIK